jgi:hypothetical protein
MILQSVEQLSAGAGQISLTFFQDLPVVVEPSSAMMSSDGGLLVLRQFDERLGITQQFCQAIEDGRDPDSTEHSVAEMVRARIYGILADYVDQNDHDTLRSDPVFKLLAGRSPDGAALASQPTLSRFENMITPRDLFRMRDVLIDQFIGSFSTPPRHLTFDMDAVDDPTHGEQQLTLFHGHFEQYQYFPAFTTCAENDQVVVASLRHGTAHAAFGLDDDLEYLVTRLRAAWPDVHIHVRGDAGCGVPWMYAVCERLRIDYSFGLHQPGFAAENGRFAGSGGDAIRGHRRAATAVHVLRVSGGIVAAAAAGDCQSGGTRPRHQPPLRGQQSSRRGAVAQRGIRRIRQPRREREPEQGAQVRVVDRSVERSSFMGTFACTCT